MSEDRVWAIKLAGRRADVLRDLPSTPGFENLPSWAQHALVEGVRALPEVAGYGVLAKAHGNLGVYLSHFELSVDHVMLAAPQQ